MPIDTPPLPSVREHELRRLGFALETTWTPTAINLYIYRGDSHIRYQLDGASYEEWRHGHDVDGHIVSYQLPGTRAGRDELFTMLRIIGIRAVLPEEQDERERERTVLHHIRTSIERSLSSFIGQPISRVQPSVGRDVRVEQDPDDPTRVNVQMNVNVQPVPGFLRMAIKTAVDELPDDVRPEVEKALSEQDPVEPRFQARRIIDVE